MSIVSNLVVGLIVAIILIAIAVRLLSWLYVKSSGETAFVRTGFRGRRVVLNGGALVIPVLHQTVPVNLSTLRLEVLRGKEAALSTADHMRVDVHVAFYVRVAQQPDAIALAAQTLGNRTTDPQALTELVEGKFVDVLRAVAAGMSMQDLHRKRGDFVRAVKDAVAEDLARNGLELESVSLLDLNQTALQYFDSKNAFDAEGLTRVTEQIEKRRETRAAIAQTTELAIRRKELEVQFEQLALDKEHLAIGQEVEFARLAQAEAIAVRRAEQQAAIASEEALRRRRADEATIGARLQTGQAETGAKQELELRLIESELAVATARSAAERQVREAEILRQRGVDMARVEAGQVLQIAEAERSVALAAAEIEVAAARARSSSARIQQVRTEEAVLTAQAEEKTLREKLLASLGAERLLIAASGEADAERMRAEAAHRVAEIEADARRLLNEADNALSAEQTAMRVKLRTIEHLPDIIRESVRPMERIDSIRIAQVEGLTRSGDGGSLRDGMLGEPRNLAEQVVDSALRYRAQAPLVDELLREVGIAGVARLAQNATQTTTHDALPPEPAQ
jgi:uncharacterized membrane protein YqiK